MGKRSREREKSVWGGEGLESIERDRRKMRENHAESLYRKSRFLMDRKVSRVVEI